MTVQMPEKTKDDILNKFDELTQEEKIRVYRFSRRSVMFSFAHLLMSYCVAPLMVIAAVVMLIVGSPAAVSMFLFAGAMFVTGIACRTVSVRNAEKVLLVLPID